MVFDYLFEGITKKEIIISVIGGLSAGVGWAFGSIIAIIFLELTLRKFLKNLHLISLLTRIHLDLIINKKNKI